MVVLVKASKNHCRGIKELVHRLQVVDPCSRILRSFFVLLHLKMLEFAVQKKSSTSSGSYDSENPTKKTSKLTFIIVGPGDIQSVYVAKRNTHKYVKITLDFGSQQFKIK